MDARVEPVAVVGMAAKFPGARNIDEFWRNLVDGRESITFWDAAALRASGADPATVSHPDYVPAAPVMPEAELFDAGLFGMTAREAELCDPQLRAFLEMCHAAVENAGYDPFAMPDSVGVFAAAGPGEHLSQLRRHRPELLGSSGMLAETLNHLDYLAPLVAYKLDLRGPAMTVLTACSSTLTTVHVACQALRSGECDAAIAGGAVVKVPQHPGYLWTPADVLSRDGHCRPFDAQASGTIFGSGAAAVVLKRLDDAYADGDDIRAVIVGGAVNNDGADKLSFSAPSVSGQAAVIAEAMALAGVGPADVGYVEAHATGTALGDPVEVAALAEAYQRLADRPLPAGSCILGAVKSNIGHLDAVAGIAGLIKTVLVLQREAIPATVHLRSQNPRLGLESTPFRLADQLRRWPRDPDRRRVAGVTALGIGGTNAHLVLEEGPPLPPSTPEQRPRVVVWSAGSVAGERRLRAALGAFFAGDGADRFADAVATLQHGRSRHRVRAATVCDSAAAAAAALAGAPGAAAVLTGEADRDPGYPVAFLLPGPSAGALARAHGLYGVVREFTVPMDECLEQFEAAGTPLYERWTAATSPGAAADDGPAELLWFAVLCSLATLWQRAGVAPAAVLGTGGAGLAASVVAGALTQSEAVGRLAGAERARPGRTGSAPARVPLYLAKTDDPAGDLGEWDGALGAMLAAHRPGVLLELGPAGALTTAVRQRPDLADAALVTSLGDRGDAQTGLLEAVARLWLRGCAIDLAPLDQPPPRVRVELPGYPYERQHYGAGPAPAEAAAATSLPQPGELVSTVGWVERESPPPPRVLGGHRAAVLLLPDREDDARPVVRAAERAGLRVTPVRHGNEYEELSGEYQVRPERPEDLARVLDRVPGTGTDPLVIVHAATCDDPEPAAELAQRLRSGFVSLFSLAKALGSRHWPAPPQLVLLSRHSVDVSGAEPVDPARAAVHGLFRTILAEQPELAGVSLDVGPRVDVDRLAAELIAAWADPLVALRGRHRWSPVERTLSLAPGEAPLRRGGVYLITGGTGALGLAVARGLADTGLGPRIALLSRSGDLDSATRADLRARGADIAAYGCDVTDAAALSRVVGEVTARWGPVAGLFHLAGLPGGRMLAFRDLADAAAVLAPKTAGTAGLERVFAGQPELDFAVYFSSLAATDGLVGGGDYAAANAYLDAASMASPLAGGRVLSVGWPAWQGAGMAVAAGVDVTGLNQTVRQLAARGADRTASSVGTSSPVSEAAPALEWEREVSQASEWALDEHRLGAVPLLPGAALVDFIVRAFRELVGQPQGDAVELTDLAFRAPLLAPAPRVLRVGFQPESGGYRLAAESRPAAGGDWCAHATARIAAAARPGPVTVDLSRVRDRFEAAGQGERASPARPALTRGPRWRTITSRTALPGERLLRITLPAAYESDLAGHALHPALLDTAISGVVAADHAGAMPRHCRRMTVSGGLPARFYAHVRYDGAEPTGDVDLVADDGTLLVRVEGITLAEVGPERVDEPSAARAASGPVEAPGAGEPPVRGIAPEAGVRLLWRMLAAGHSGRVLVRQATGAAEPATSAGPTAAPAGPAAAEPARAESPGAGPPAAATTGASLMDRLTLLWRDVLGTTTATADQDFFDTGGNSLSAVDLMARVRDEFGVELGAGVILRARTLADLEAVVREQLMPS